MRLDRINAEARRRQRGDAGVEMLLALPVLFVFFAAAVGFGRGQRIQTAAHAAARHAAFHDGREANAPDLQPNYGPESSDSGTFTDGGLAGQSWTFEGHSAPVPLTVEDLREVHFGRKYEVTYDGDTQDAAPWARDQQWQGTVKDLLAQSALSNILDSSFTQLHTLRTKADLEGLRAFGQGNLKYSRAEVRTDYAPLGRLLSSRLRPKSRVVVMTSTAPAEKGLSALPWFEPLVYATPLNVGSAPRQSLWWIETSYAQGFLSGLSDTVEQVYREGVDWAIRISRVFRAWFPTDVHDEILKPDDPEEGDDQDG